MTPITYKQASEILGIVEGSLHHAITRGILTKLPRQGVHQRLIQEQVELFKGKRLSIKSLSNTEKELWTIYKLEGLAQEGDEQAEQELQKLSLERAKELIELFALLTGGASNFPQPVALQ